MKRYNLSTYGYSRLFDEDINGEWVKWEDVSEGYEPCEGCHLPPVSCNGFTLKQACEHIEKLRTTLKEWAAEAEEDVNHWGGYASNYFQEKHDYVGDINKWITRKEEV